jgi:hypothetical protein
MAARSHHPTQKGAIAVTVSAEGCDLLTVRIDAR